MADNFPQYPATSFDQAVDLTIYASNQLGDVINGDATSVVSTESGDIPTLRKALIDNFYFKNPIQWNPGNTNTVFNQLYVFDTDNINKGWYYAPTATLSNPILMGTTPVGDANWKLYSLVSKETNIEAIARVFGLKKRQVGYLSTATAVDSYTILYDENTQTCWYRGGATGTPVNWIVEDKSLMLTTSNGSYILYAGYSGDTLRQDLGSIQPGLGADLVGLEGAGTVYDALTRVNVLRFGADPTGQTDSSAAARKARDFAVARGINEIYFPAGWDYVCADYIEDIYLPGDDGTVNPAWVGVNGDVNIAPELQYKAKTFCRLPRGMRITGDGKHATRIRGNWNNASSTIPTTIGDVPASAGYGFFWSNNNNKSAANGHGIVGVTLAQYFVARGGDGIMVESLEDDLIIEDCYFSGIFQGAERCKSHWLEEKRVYAPTIVGGHWLQRNNTQTVSQLPPYPATDAWTLGWCDAWTYGTHHHTQYQGAWGSRHVDGDKFFDNMYFKSRNTLTYANGGRLSNNSNNPASIPKWEGVVGRARVLLSRYGRQINSNGTDFFKSMGEHRTPYYCATPGGNNVIHDCFLEAIGLVDNRMEAGGGNYFGIAVPDPLNPGQSGIGYMVGVGGIQLANYTTSARLQHAPLVSSANRLYGSQQYVNFVKVATNNFEMERRSVWDGSNTTIKYQRNNNDCFSQPIAFSLGGEKLNYSVLSFTPGITIGGVANSSLTGNGYLVKTGRQLVIRCRFTASSALDLPTGAVKITGLPYSIPSNLYGISFGFAYCPQLVNSISVFPRVSDVATEINLIKDSKGTALDGDDFSTTQAIFLWVEMTATILE